MMIDYDSYGHCCSCHKNMLIEQVVGGNVIKRFTADYDEVQYLLNDGSKMRVTICKQCKELDKHSDTSNIMECIIKGWQKEVDDLVADENKPNWTQEKANEHMEWYGNLEIVSDTDKHDEDSLNRKLEDHKNNIRIDKVLILKES